jgi:starch-binding outer membrane protein, SusD/RagB family
MSNSKKESMKFLNRLFLSLLIILPIQSCDDILDKEPPSRLTDKDLGEEGIPTAAQVEAFLSGCYADFFNEYFMLDYFVIGDAQADNAYAGADNPANFQIDEFKIEAVNSNVERDWRYLYATIAKCNTVLDNVGNVIDPALTETRKQEIIGEASFIRAFMYFELIRQFGDVPLLVKEIAEIDLEKLDEIYLSRTPAAEVYAQIIADLETALVKVRPTAPDKGYATRGAVNAMLAKVYATIEPHDWNKVSQYCDAVIGGGYTLLPKYDQLWDLSQENSSESIFESNCYGWDTGGNWGTSMFSGTDWKKFNTPTNDLVKAYDDEGDLIRKNSNIRFEDVTGKWPDRYWSLSTYPLINKYRDFSGAGNFILIRLADILLLKAEALNELGEVDEAAALVNQIRDRVELAPTTASTQSDMRLAIEKERRFELAFEGHRWHDLKRTGRAIEVMNALKDGNGSSLGYALDENRLLWPIPQTERDKNDKLTQNDAY